jgi:hypothetical protein
VDGASSEVDESITKFDGTGNFGQSANRVPAGRRRDRLP